MQAQAFSGPIPPASELAYYEQIIPGLADRIVGMAESNATHRQGMEKAVVVGNIAAQKRGQVFAFILALIVVIVGTVLVYQGKTNAGLWLILGDIVALAAVFLGGKFLQKKERSARRSELEEKAT